VRNDFYTPEVQGPYEMHDLGDFDLEEGGTIPGLRLATRRTAS
jgi:homoserine O-acetyltransferase/O-succinyltransferase